MRFVTRPDDAIPTPWTTKATTETKDAIAAYKAAVKKLKKSRAKKGKKPALDFTYPFKVYGDVLLRDAINKLYRFKCAYCETFFGATQPVAVEHYRPKGEVIEGKVRVKPGYYWLAAAPDNLLPSCTDCNSPRRQEESDGTKRVRGKGNYFPLAPKTKRAKSPGQEKKESPLLLHPEKDKPEKHLEFLVARDRLGVIRATLVNNKPSPKGEASIEVYALDRPQLVMNRQNVAKRMVSHLRNTRLSLRLHKADPTDAELKQAYDDNIEDLRDMLGEDQQYLAMLKAILRTEFPDHAPII